MENYLENREVSAKAESDGIDVFRRVISNSFANAVSAPV
jgi:hypothetical protein